MKSNLISVALIALIAMTEGCAGDESAPPERVAQPAFPSAASQSPKQEERKVPAMQLTSSFSEGERIDQQYTGQGADRSPPLKWSGAPEATKSFALICDDPDAPSPQKPAATPWVHWVIFNIPASTTELPEGIPRVAQVEQVAGARQGQNSWPRDNLGYRGPMPPKGSGTHRYFFKLYALDDQLQLEAKTTDKAKLLEAMQGHILAAGQLMGTYEIP
jgi:Raf kinase inhibitor-like YbhB/YbcL family protein